MNKSELVERLAIKSSINNFQAEEVVNIIYKKMKDALVNDGRIEIRGFGSFTVRKYKERMARNPKTGASIQISSKKLPFFKLGKELNERLNLTSSFDKE